MQTESNLYECKTERVAKMSPYEKRGKQSENIQQTPSQTVEDEQTKR